jgi:hypothetical protein
VKQTTEERHCSRFASPIVLANITQQKPKVAKSQLVPDDGQAGSWAVRRQVDEKWDEQVFRIGETVSHEEISAAPHRRSSTQTEQD